MGNQRRNEQGRRIRTIPERVKYWSSSDRALLDSPFSDEVYYRIDVLRKSNSLSEIVISSTGDRQDSPVVEGRYSVNWALIDYTGSRKTLLSSINSLIHVYGLTPSHNDQNGIRSQPYTDMVFRNGDIDVALIENPTKRLYLGKVIGLTIVTPEIDVRVWEPENL